MDTQEHRAKMEKLRDERIVRRASRQIMKYPLEDLKEYMSTFRLNTDVSTPELRD